MPRRKISTRTGDAAALPHERDESTDLPHAPRPVIRQAEQDVASGQTDTDNYTRAAATTGVMQDGKKQPKP